MPPSAEVVDALRSWLQRQTRPRGLAAICAALTGLRWQHCPPDALAVRAALRYLAGRNEARHTPHSGWSYLPLTTQRKMQGGGN